MNSVQLHLAFTHVPVILSLAGLAMLVIALLKKDPMLTKTAYVFIMLAGIAALPVFFSGEGTEEGVENLPGVSEAIIEQHEEVAKLAMISIAAAGILSLTALFPFKRLWIARFLQTVVLILAITSGGLMAQTAHLGGQIRHTEIRSGVSGNAIKAVENAPEVNNSRLNEPHDDEH